MTGAGRGLPAQSDLPARPDLPWVCAGAGWRSMKKRFEKAVIDDITIATEFLEAALESLGCPMKTILQMDTVLDELFCNVVKYAYPAGPGPLELSIEAGAEPGSFVLTMQDEGTPFNPLERREPDTTLSAEERPIGGLGIHIVRKLTDDVSYGYIDGKNTLRILKRY